MLITWAGVVPDVDAISWFWGIEAYVRYHHVLTHGLVAAVTTAALCAVFARQRLRVLLLSLASFHLHLLCDYFGSGAEGSHWPIYYFYPFAWTEFITSWGWDLASPQNAAVWLAAVSLTAWIGVTGGRTFLEAFLPARADAAVVRLLRKIFPRPVTTPASP
jgi:hypothetical protein